MDDFEKHIEHTFRGVRRIFLSSSEREEMKRHLRLFMAEHPRRLRRSFFTFRHLLLQPILASLAVLLFLAGGTSYAAQYSLPGDTLYAVKVGITEPLTGSLKTSAAERAQWNATLAVRRLEEVEALVAQKRLTPTVQAEVEQRFEAHAAEFDSDIATLEQEHEAVVTSADVQSNLEVTLEAHSAVLAGMNASSSVTGAGISPILSKVRARTEHVVDRRKETEAKVARQVGEAIKVAATQKREIAEARISKRRSKREKNISAAAPLMQALSATSTTTEDKAIDAFENGQIKLEEGRYGEAFTNFQAAIRDEDVKRMRRALKEHLADEGVSIREEKSKSNGKDADIHMEEED